MEENPRRPRLKKRAHKAQSTSRSSSPPRDLGRFRGAAETGECSVDCSGQSCRSCSAALVADCVALCCCPLAVVSLLGLALIKVPCAMGKRCLGGRKRKEKKKVCVGSRKESGRGSFGKEEEFGVKSVKGKSRETVVEFGDKEANQVVEQRSLCAAEANEADNVLLEMYQVGHLGFGGVSYTETQQPNGVGS